MRIRFIGADAAVANYRYRCEPTGPAVRLASGLHFAVSIEIFTVVIITLPGPGTDIPAQGTLGE